MNRILMISVAFLLSCQLSGCYSYKDYQRNGYEPDANPTKGELNRLTDEANHAPKK